jgi:hypothetical protein
LERMRRFVPDPVITKPLNLPNCDEKFAES